MAIIKTKKKGYRSFLECYELDNLKYVIGRPFGADIVFKIINNRDIDFKYLSMMGENEDIGVPVSVFNTRNREDIDSINKLIKIFDREDLFSWELQLLFKGDSILVSGYTQSNCITISYLLDKEIDVIPLLKEIEQ